MHWSVFMHLTVWLLSVLVTTDRHWPNKHHLAVGRWMENWKIYFLKDEWKLAPVAISSLVDNSTIWLPAFDLDASGHSWITSGPTKATAHPVEKSGAMQQPWLVVANAKQFTCCQQLSTVQGRGGQLQRLHSADDIATKWLKTYFS